MGGFFTLLSLSIVMAAASFLAGILPLSINMSQGRLRLISTIGMGVLVGTSLIIIIPEGVETLYTSANVAHSGLRTRQDVDTHAQTARWVLNARDDRTVQERVPVIHDILPRVPLGASPLDMPGPVIPSSLGDPPETPTEPGVVGILDTGEQIGKNGDHTYAEEENAHHAWIGVALVSGFILMFLIDKLPKTTSTAASKPRTHHIALNNLGGRFNLTTSLDPEEESETFLENNQTPESRSRSSATTIGLVIHAAADGIALGASSSASNTNLSLIIFFAIMFHKAPAAFGLTSMLLRQGLSKRMARAHLVVFSMAAPIGALLTWIVARVLGAGLDDNTQNTQWWTGILLLFSAGTFLYVAMHSMQEISHGTPHEHGTNGQANGTIGEGRDTSRKEDDKPSFKDLAAAVFGMILPLFLQVGHAH